MNCPLLARLTRVLSRFHRSGTDSTRVVCTLRSRARTRGVYECLSRATSIAILFLTLSVSCGTFSKSWTRVIPRARRELRRNFLRDWKRTLEDGRDGENFHTSKEFEVRIISLRRGRERSLESARSLDEQGITWSYHDAVDGLDELDVKSLNKYAGRKKRTRVDATRHIPRSTLVQRAYDDTKRPSHAMRQSLHERLRFGCYLSHVSLWRRVIRAEAPLAIVLEDDAVVSSKFARALVSRLDKLPIDWDVLFLNGCFKKFGPALADGIRQSRGGLCTYSYVISAKGAFTLMRRATLRSEKPIDHVLDGEILAGRLLAFHADPPLARTVPKTSTLAY
ncbi:Glycosyl transferase, family 25 [Ostreococcus tauri]|uniref:Glycosyl transferase, family 25 n=1 Tax=Ostreococcus tauri TaxID=70448 RepID=A0A090MDL6_OSTTA|nr:Glycosyl transferase, family 25 [Ostreococcus tauri]CEG01016.1 Glycosyl transferase, family 25 [Ostreococcus tauri]|eukprot:XP_022840744.1 Glycosyl transferase, family 25 [Ostreococcus tauri]